MILSVNARGADGTDTSWLWDVDYTRLAGHPICVIGDRKLDLAVRLEVAGLDFRVCESARRGGAARPARPDRGDRQLHRLPGPAPPRRQLTRGPVKELTSMSDSSLRLVWVYPDLLSTYGDQGNALVVERRARQRGLDVHAHRRPLRPADPHLRRHLPDRRRRGPAAAARRRAAAPRRRAAAGPSSNGAIIFSVCAGYQILGHEFVNDLGRARAGPRACSTWSARRGEGERCVGDVLGGHRPAAGPAAADRLREPPGRHPPRPDGPPVRPGAARQAATARATAPRARTTTPSSARTCTAP